MNYAVVDEPLFDTEIDINKHFEFRAGKWWVCDQTDCDGHHYYVRTRL